MCKISHFLFPFRNPYLSALHMTVSMEKVNDAISFERSRFRKIHELIKNLVSIVLISLILRLYSKATRAVKDKHTQTTVILLRMRRGLINVIDMMGMTRSL